MSIDTTIDFVQTPSTPATPAVRTRASHGLLWRMARDVSIMVLIVLAAEIALQLLAPEYGHDYYDRTLTASQPVTFNADGYRGPVVPLQKAAGEMRIIALGDSTTFGTGVAVEQTWPLQLRDFLAADHPATDHPFTVMNVGLQGASLADMAYAYDTKWSAYHPDVVTVMVSSNMIAMAYIRRNLPAQMPAYVLHGEEQPSLKERLSQQYGRLCLPHFLSLTTQRALYWLGVMDHRIADPRQPFGALLAHGWNQGDVSTDEIDQAWACFAKELDQLQAEVNRHGAKLLIGFSPCRFDISTSLFDNEKNVPLNRLTIDPSKRIAELCAARNIQFIDTLNAIRQGRKTLTEQRGQTASMYIMFDYNHLNGDGQAAVAGAFLPFVRQSDH
ncbi:MAG: hypothetical protein JO353_05575 [Phycisphaerae bacterium]|nr:hypothetical protein [Phycisphaerae bacterium]